MIENLQIRPMRRSELDTLVSWAAKEGWNPGHHDADIFWDTDPDGFIAAEIDGEMIGGGSIVSYQRQFGFFSCPRAAWTRFSWRAAPNGEGFAECYFVVMLGGRDAPRGRSHAARGNERNKKMKEVFGCARMYFGGKPTLPNAHIYGITTFELG